MGALFQILTLLLSPAALAAEDCSVAAKTEAPPSKFCDQKGPSESYLANALGMHQRLLTVPEVKASYQGFLDGLKELEKFRSTLCARKAKFRSVPADSACPSREDIDSAEHAAKDLFAYATEAREAYSGFEKKWKEKHERLGRAAVQAVSSSEWRQFAGHLERELHRNNFNQDRHREGLNAYERVLDQFYLEYNLHIAYRAAAYKARSCFEIKREGCVPEDPPFRD